MLDVLNFENTKDGYGCGYYICATSCQFTEYFNELGPLLYFEYKPQITEIYISASVSGYFECVKEIYQRKRVLGQEIQNCDGLILKLKVSDLNVMMDISPNRIVF